MSRRTKRRGTKRAEQAGKTLNQAAEKTTDSINNSINETMDNTGAAINDVAEKPVKQHHRKLRIVALKDADCDKR